MEFKPDSHSDNNIFDDFDCPRRLESIEQAQVDDSWFFRQSDSTESTIKMGFSSHQPANEIFSDKLSVIEENTYCGATASGSLKSSKRRDAQDSPDSQPSQSSSPTDSLGPSSIDGAASASAAPCLATEGRCQLRSKWEQLRQQRERHHEQLRQQRKESLCRREHKQLLQLRAASVPKAHPIRHYKPMRIQRSDKPLTVAKSPDFALARRQRQRSQLEPAE